MSTYTYDELDGLYDDYLDSEGDHTVCGFDFAPSRILKAVDPIAYRVGKSDWHDAEVQNGGLIPIEDPDSPDAEEMWTDDASDVPGDEDDDA